MAMYSTYMLHSRFQGHGVIFRPINALDVLCVQLTRDLFAIAKFLFEIRVMKQSLTARHKKTVSLMQCRFFHSGCHNSFDPSPCPHVSTSG